MIAISKSFTLEGITAREVTVEVDVHRGLPHFQIIGLPDVAVRESRERVRAATTNSGFEFPMRRITCNLAPADLRRAGPALDLAIAAATLAAAGEIGGRELEGFALAGELALDGSVRPVRGALAMAEAARDAGLNGIVVPVANGPEAALVKGIDVRTINNLCELRNPTPDGYGTVAPLPEIETAHRLPDIADLRGQPKLRFALEVAAAGGHSMLMVGPPGSGKSLAARRLPSILPPLDQQEMLEVTRIQSASGIGTGTVSQNRPFRAPHHTVSAAGLVGGGSPMRPGEITLAHRGVLFLDELVEFSRTALEGLRQPLNEKQIMIARGPRHMTFPADVQLIAGSSPCACGFGPDTEACRCSEASITRYQAALSGALADRIDIQIRTEGPTVQDLTGPAGESSEEVLERVMAARERMEYRYRPGHPNATATTCEISLIDLTEKARVALSEEVPSIGRTVVTTLKLARTIADLDDCSQINDKHIEQARKLTRRGQPAVA